MIVPNTALSLSRSLSLSLPLIRFLSLARERGALSIVTAGALGPSVVSVDSNEPELFRGVLPTSPPAGRVFLHVNNISSAGPGGAPVDACVYS